MIKGEKMQVDPFLCLFNLQFGRILNSICKYYFKEQSFERLKPTIDEIIPEGQGLLGIFFLGHV